MRACGSLRADRAVTIFAFSHLPTVASFPSFVPHSLSKATFGNPRKSSSFSPLHEPSHLHFAIPILQLQYPSTIPEKIENITIIQHTQVLLHYDSVNVPLHSVPTLAFPSTEAKNRASPAVNGRRLPPSFLGLLQPPPLLRSQAARAFWFTCLSLYTKTNSPQLRRLEIIFRF